MLGKYVKFRQEKFGGVIFETLKERVFTVNETGSAIMVLLQKGHGEQEVVAALARDYDSNRASIEMEVRSFIEFLEREGLLESKKVVA